MTRTQKTLAVLAVLVVVIVVAVILLLRWLNADSGLVYPGNHRSPLPTYSGRPYSSHPSPTPNHSSHTP